MVVIWGLDLADMQWGKFKSSYMFKNRDYHLRRTKFIVYQLAMIFCVVSESLGTDAISKYVDQQKRLERRPGVFVKNNDIVGSFSFNIFVGVFVATIFGAAFFFDLFWPERSETKAVRIAWKACAVLASCFALASAILLTVVIATHRATVTGMEHIKENPPLLYKKNGRAVASVVLIWLGFLATVWSTFLMFASINYIEAYGPFSTHARRSPKIGIDGVDGIEMSQAEREAV